MPSRRSTVLSVVLPIAAILIMASPVGGQPCSFDFKFGYSGGGDGQRGLPVGVAMDEAERVYVADANNNRIQV